MKKDIPTMIKKFDIDGLQKQIKLLPKDFQVRLAVFAAELVLDKVKPQHKETCAEAVKIAKLYLEGEASEEENLTMVSTIHAANGFSTGFQGYYMASSIAPFVSAIACASASIGDSACYGADTSYWTAHAIYFAGSYPETIPKIVTYYEKLKIK